MSSETGPAATHDTLNRRNGRAKGGASVACGLVAVLSLAAACGKEEPPPPGKDGTGAVVKPREPPPMPVREVRPPEPIGKGARILIDMSMSMQGFLTGNPIAENGQKVKGTTAKTDSVAIENLLNAVGESLGKANAGELDYCEIGIGGTGEPKCKDVGAKPGNYRDTARFSATRSPIAAALSPREAAVGTEPSPQGIVRGAVDDRRITVLVTDGVQADPMDGGERPKACQAGADLYCFRDVLVARAKAGYHIWLVAASLRFDGTVYAEQGLTAQQFEMTKAHLADLRKQSGWNSEFKRLEADHFALTTNAKDAKFTYRGARPILIVVLTRDSSQSEGREFGQAVADGIVERLRASTAGLLAPAGRIESMRLTGYGVGKHGFSGFAKQRVKPGVGEAAEALADADAKLVPVGGVPKVGPNGLTAALQCVPGDGPGGKATFVASWDANTQPPSPPLPAECLAEQVDVAFSTNPAMPGAFVSGPVPPGARAHSMLLNCDKLHDKSIRITGSIAARLVARQDCAGWWTRWNAPDTFSQPENIAMLADLVSAVLKTNLGEPAVQHRLDVKVDWTPE